MTKRGILFLLFWAMAATVFSQPSASEQALLSAIQANPKDETAHYNLGLSYLKDRQFEQAISEFQKCLQINATDNQAKELLEICEGVVAQKKGNNSEAIEHFKNVLKINPNNTDAKNSLAQCLAKTYMEQKQYTAAIEQLKIVLAADKNNFGAYQNLGVAYYLMKDYKNAVAYWGKALKIQKDAQTYKFIGYSYYNLGDFNNAIDNYERSLKMNPDDSETYYNLAVAYNDNGNYDESADNFGKAFKINPKDSNAAIGQANAIEASTNLHMEKASSYLLNNQYTDAISEWQKVLKLQPDNKQVKDFIADAQAKLSIEVKKHDAAGWEYYHRGDKLNALNEWNIVLEMDPENEAVRQQIKKTKNPKPSGEIKKLMIAGDRAFAAQDYSGALEIYSKANKINPQSASVKAAFKKVAKQIKSFLDQAKRFYSHGDLKTAQKYLSEAKQIAPKNPEIASLSFRVQKDITVKVGELNDEGVSLFQNGKKEEAKKKFQMTLKLKPTDETANDYIKRMTGQQSQAKVDAEKVKSLYYDAVNLYINGKIKEAIAEWQECVRQDPGNINAQNNILKAKSKLLSIQKLSTN